MSGHYAPSRTRTSRSTQSSQLGPSSRTAVPEPSMPAAPTRQTTGMAPPFPPQASTTSTSTTSSVRRNLFKSLKTASSSISAAASSSRARITGTTARRPVSALEEESEDEDVVERDKGGAVKLNIPEMIEVDEEDEQIVMEQLQAVMDQIHRRTGTERLDSQEALRRTVASLDDDKWMYEGEDEF